MIRFIRWFFSWLRCLFKMPVLWATQWSQLDYIRMHQRSIAESLQAIKEYQQRKHKVDCGILLFAIGPGSKPFICGRRHRIYPGETIQDGFQPDCELINGLMVAWGPSVIIDANAANNGLSVWSNCSMPAVFLPAVLPSQRVNYVLKADERD